MLVDEHWFTIPELKVVENSKGGTFYGMPSSEYTSKEGETKWKNHCGFFTKPGYAAFYEEATRAFKHYFDMKKQEEQTETLELREDDNVPF